MRILLVTLSVAVGRIDCFTTHKPERSFCVSQGQGDTKEKAKGRAAAMAKARSSPKGKGAAAAGGGSQAFQVVEEAPQGMIDLFG